MLVFFCGIVGFKFIWGFVFYIGIIGLDVSIDYVGLMIKNVFDVVFFLQVIVGRDGLDDR